MEMDAGQSDQSGNVSSTIMYNIPTESLPSLRKDFDKSPEGLSLIRFLNVMVKTMDLHSEKQLMSIIPDLVDFFKSVDINGDGKMEWSEFVMFVIESVVVADQIIMEKVENVEHTLLQSAASRHGVKCTKLLPEFNRMFIGMGPTILIFQADDHSSSWLDKGITLRLNHRVIDTGNDSKSMIRQPKDDKMEKSLKCLDLVFLGAKEMLIVLRSDMSLEFHRFMARTKVAPDLIQQNGFWLFDQPYHKMALRQMASGRGSSRVPWRLFLIGESRSTIDSWQVSVGTTGVVGLQDPYVFNNHTDYVTDIMVIDSGFFHLFVSCSMDQRVLIYDLVTLQQKAVRTGHTAGVCCLGFDGRSLIMAGGFDFNIIAWDLDAEIDRPIFQLWGHESPVTKIVPIGNIDRCFSLDASGKVFFWDTSKGNPNDKEARQIDSFSYVDDTIRSFDVFQNVSSNFLTSHQVFLACQGRRQHIYKIKDLTPKESAPLPKGVLFSYNLLMMITVHSHDALFFSAATGDEQKKMPRNMLHLNNLANEIMSSCLDDRQRKLIIGEASGNISVYNVLSGVRLKQTATNVPFAIRDMIYTPDKTIIALAGPGELYIFDELPNEDGKDCTLRYIQAHEVDVVSMTYSYELSLIATADCTGCVRVFDYQFMNLLISINECVGSEIGQISFITGYPLLLVTDTQNNMSIVAVGPAYQAHGRKIWRVKNEVNTERQSMMHDKSSLYPIPDNSDSEDDVDNELDQLEASMKLPPDAASTADAEAARGSPNGAPAKESKPNSRSSSPVNSSNKAAGTGSNAGSAVGSRAGSPTMEKGGTIPEDEEEEEEEEEGQKPFKKKAVQEFLRKRRECKSICIVIQKSNELEEEERFERNIVEETKESRLFELLGKSNDESDSDSDLSSEADSVESLDSRRQEMLGKSCTTEGFPEIGERVFALCGTDDGHIVVVDLTPTMREIDMSHVYFHEWVPNRKTYDPRRQSMSQIKESELNSMTWRPNEIAVGEQETVGHVSLVWMAHAGAVTTLYMIGERKDGEKDILSGGQDYAVYTWNTNGTSKGTLTRGRYWDKLFKPRWKTPIDFEERQLRREKDAAILCDALGLKKVMHTYGLANTKRLDRKQMLAVAEEEKEGERRVIEELRVLNTSGAFSDSRTNSIASVAESSASSKSKSVSDRMSEGQGFIEDETENARVIGQLRGRITYKLSNKDIAAGALQEKHSASMTMIGSIGKEKVKKKKLGPFDIDTSLKAVRTKEGLWLDGLMDGASGIGVEVGMKHAAGKRAAESSSGKGVTAGASDGGPKPRKIKTKYDLELAAIEAIDPNNWEIHSVNRQRALYGMMYAEMDKQGTVKDPGAIFEHKLNKIAGGDFRSFVAKIWAERSVSGSESLRKNSIKEVSQESIDNISYRVNIRTASSLEADSSFVQVEHEGNFKDGELEPKEVVKVHGRAKERAADGGSPESKRDADDVTIDFKWQNSLRLPIFASPYAHLKDGIPKSRKEAASFVSKASQLNDLIGTPSPMKLTPAQLKAIEERKVVEELRAQFEKTLNRTEKMAKLSNRIVRKKKKVHRQKLKQILASSDLSPVEQIRLSLRGSASLNTIDTSLLLNKQPETRHSMAQLAHAQTKTIDDIMNVTRKQNFAENNWRRKLDFTLSEDDERTTKTPRSIDTSITESKNSKKKNNPRDSNARDVRILGKKKFGPYKVAELLRFMQSFQSIAPEKPDKDDDDISITPSLASLNTIESRDDDHRNEGEGEKLAFRNFYARDSAEEDSDDDWPTDDDTRDRESRDGAETSEQEDGSEEALLEKERLKHEAAARRAAELQKERDAKHAIDVVTTNVRLLPFINTKFMKMNNQYKTELVRVLNKRTEDGTLARNVLINLTDALTFCCPYMDVAERNLCLRLFVLKTPQTVEHVEATEKGLTREQLAKLKSMFEFFDKDGSGGIDKFEIVEVLEKLAENNKKDATEDKNDDSDELGAKLEDAEMLIASVQGHDCEELDFDSFIKMFKNMV